MLTAPELVREAMKATGSKTPTALARALNLTAYSAPRNIQRWLDGISAPEFESTLALLEAAGRLSASPKSAAAKATRPGRALDKRELAAAIDEVTNVLVRLQRLVDAQEPPQEGRRRRRA